MLSLTLLLGGVDAAILRTAAVTPRAAPPQCVAVSAPYDTEAFDKVVMKTCAAARHPPTPPLPHAVALVFSRAVGGSFSRSSMPA
jgi:hypothetical protein